MPRILLSLLASVLALAAAVVAQVPPAVPPPLAPRVSLAPPQLLQQFDVVSGSLQELLLPRQLPSAIDIPVVLGGAVVVLSLQPFELRAPGYTLIERSMAGELLWPWTPCTTFRGAIIGEAGSEIAASLRPAAMGELGLTAWIRRADGALWLVQPLREVAAAAGNAAHLVYRAEDSSNLPVRCGAQAAVTGTLPVIPDHDQLYACEMAIEADFPFFQANGSSVTATQNDVLAVVNAMDVIYRRDTQIALQVPTLIVNSTSDVYTSSSAGTLLSQFRSYWNSTRGSIARDVAHLFTGRPMGQVSGGAIGVAYLGTVCNRSNAYGVSQSRFSSNWNYRVAVTAHELGHNFNAGHCDAAASCRIMCSGVGGCTNNQTSFGPTEQNQIINFRNAVNCLQLLPTTPVISSVSPTFVRTFQPGQVTLTGTGFTGTTSVRVGTVQLTSGFSVPSDTQLRLNPPVGLPLGLQQLVVTNAAGSSNLAGLFYSGADPCLLSVPAAVLGGSTLTWSFGGWPLNPAFLVLSLQNSTSPFQGQQVLDGFSVLWVGGLDARGMGSYSMPVPPAILNGVRAYSQLIDIDSPTLAVRSTSVVASTLVIQ